MISWLPLDIFRRRKERELIVAEEVIEQKTTSEDKNKIGLVKWVARRRGIHEYLQYRKEKKIGL